MVIKKLRSEILRYLWSPWRMNYIQGNKTENGCILCHEAAQQDSPRNLIVYRGEENFIILNRFPYTSGHLMIVPYKHCSSLDELKSETRCEMMGLTNKALAVLRLVYHPQGFNIGMNIGEAGGAGITEHIHLHIVPRWNGDTNFMSSLADTRVLPESLEDTYSRIKDAWGKVN